MWANLLSSGEAARERLASTLEKTGESLTQRASAHVAAAGQQQGEETSVSKEHDNNQTTVGGEHGQEGPTDTPPLKQESDQNTTTSQQQQESTNTTTPSPTFAAIPSSQKKTSSPSKNSNEHNNLFSKQTQNEMFSSIKMGWGSVVEATKHAVETTKDVMEKEQSKLRKNFQNTNDPYKRDITQPLDVAALRDAEVVYITDRIITTSHPAMQSPTDGDITPHRKLAAISHLLQKRHQSKYMVWNLSELPYAYEIFDNQVMTYQFPGAPSPPLGLLLKILLSMESWLKADKENVAVIHCLTGKGRTSTAVAAFLCWIGEAGFDDPMKALEYIAACKRCSVETLTIPSQRRYVSYFSNMIDGIRPSQPPLLLKRIIMSEAPKFGKCPGVSGSSSSTKGGENNSVSSSGSGVTTTPLEEERKGQVGCAPYLQIFKAGQLVFTTAASLSFHQSKDDLPFCIPSDGSITFPIETVVQGDILVRCRHLTRKGQRVSMFRAAFHTGYVPPKVMRLGKVQLDGACHDGRYGDDFFIDLIFEECDASMASQHILSQDEEEEEEGAGEDQDIGGVTVEEDEQKEASSDEAQQQVKFKDSSSSSSTSPTAKSNKKLVDGTIQNEAAARRMMGTIAGSNQGSSSATNGSTTTTVTASVYDSMLHRDSRFWDIICNRREEIRKQASSTGAAAAAATGTGTAVESKNAVPFYGPTIGRRREFADENSSTKSATDGKEGSGTKPSGSGNDTNSISSSMHSFSIGGEFDFTENDNDGKSSSSSPEATTEKKTIAKPAKKDDLMEALMALDDDLEVDTDDVEVDTDSPDTNTKEEEKEIEEMNETGSEEEIIFEDVGDVISATSENEPNTTPESSSTGVMVEAESASPSTTTTANSIAADTTIAKTTPKEQDVENKEDSSEDQSAVNVKGETESSENSGDEEPTDSTPDDINNNEEDLEESIDDYDFDGEDEDLEDLENFLMKASNK